MIDELKRALASRGIDFVYAADKAEALRLVLERIPKGASVMNGGSHTLEDIGLLDALRDGYKWLRPAIAATNDRSERNRKRREPGVWLFKSGPCAACTPNHP